MWPEGVQSRVAQAGRLRKLFGRQLSTPHCDHGGTLQEYVEWEESEAETSGGSAHQLPPTLLAAYKKAEAACSERQAWEYKVDPRTTGDAEELLNNFVVKERSWKACVAERQSANWIAVL